MKSNSAGKSRLLRTTTMSPLHGVDQGFDDKKERAMTAVRLSAVVAAIVALYAAMFGAVYLWSRYAPISSGDVVSVRRGDGNTASRELASVSGGEPNRANQYLIIGDASSAIRRDTEKSLTVYREDIVDGLEKAPEAFIGMLDGKNFGKVVVRVGV